MTDQQALSFDIAVIGAGLTGLMAATELANAPRLDGARIALVAPAANGSDRRTTAMMMPTIERLDAAGIWEIVRGHTAPLRTMRLLDGSSRLLRARMVEFEASDIGQDAFGYNVPNAVLSDTLESHLATRSAIARLETTAEHCMPTAEGVDLHLADGTTLHAAVAVAADGRDSVVRESAGISVQSWSYPQMALVTNFTHSRPHRDASTELHTETGPFTLVPLPSTAGKPYRSSLVWVVDPAQVDDLLTLSLAELGLRIEEKMQSMLGAVNVDDKLQAFPLSGMTASRFAAKRVALVGEASHVFPPIGAQGFNLGVRDCVALAETLDLANIDASLEQYDRARRTDVVSRTAAVDLLNRSLLTGFLPVQMARTAGLGLLASVPPLRKLAMRQGMGAHGRSRGS